jgi:hypothetical protein
MMEGHGLGSNWISNRLLLGILCLLVELLRSKLTLQLKLTWSSESSVAISLRLCLP